MHLAGRVGFRPFDFDPRFERLTRQEKFTGDPATIKPFIFPGSGSGKSPVPDPLRRIKVVGEIMADWGLAPISPAPGWKVRGLPRRLLQPLLLLSFPLTLTFVALVLLLKFALLLLLLFTCDLARKFDWEVDLATLVVCWKKNLIILNWKKKLN